MPEFDVVVVGASVAGCATATLMARQGLRVALVEKSPSPSHYKHLCTHEMIALANPVLERLGVLEQLRAVGGPHRSPMFWSRFGWVTAENLPGPPVEDGLNVRREVLDPLLRDVAASTPGVELRLGAVVTEMLRDGDGRPSGVELREGSETTRLSARVIVGADGANSTVAKLAELEARHAPHGRFGYASYFEGIEPFRDHDGVPASQLWMLEPDVAYAFPTDGNLMLLAVAPLKTPERIAAFKADLEGEFRKVYASLPNAPDFSGARQVGKWHGQLATRNFRRPASAAGVGLVGDAAQLTDFVWGTGCGFALSSAALLADAIGPALAAQRPDAAVDRALSRYRRAHRSAFGGHYRMTSSFSTGRALNPIEKLLFRGATRDLHVARAVRVIGSRTQTPVRAVTPSVLARAAVASARRPRTA